MARSGPARYLQVRGHSGLGGIWTHSEIGFIFVVCRFHEFVDIVAAYIEIVMYG